jgi:hypothetical protein
MSFLFLFLNWIGVLAYSELMPGLHQDEREALTVTAMYAGPVSFFAWTMVFLFVHFRSIRATEITDRSILLTGLSREFVDAYHDHPEGGLMTQPHSSRQDVAPSA